jgi:hypothetical protein
MAIPELLRLTDEQANAIFAAAHPLSPIAAAPSSRMLSTSSPRCPKSTTGCCMPPASRVRLAPVGQFYETLERGRELVKGRGILEFPYPP